MSKVEKPNAKKNKILSNNEFNEWLRGFIDGEGSI
jgi:hypothetical protein